jgi:hypothetical protein
MEAKIEALEPRTSGASFFLTEMLPFRFDAFRLAMQVGYIQVTPEGRLGESRKRIAAASFLPGVAMLSAIPGFSELVYSIRDLRLFLIGLGSGVSDKLLYQIQ